MDSTGSRRSRRSRFKDRVSLDRRFDKWLETGRQFVDGVAGTRPGQRKPYRKDGRNVSSLTNVGRWVGEKIDWFLEEEEDWLEPWEHDMESINSGSLNSKRSLDAISRRGQSSYNLSDRNKKQITYTDNEWPDEDSFKIDRWKRSRPEGAKPMNERNSKSVIREPRRPLPRFSRRREN